MAQYKVIQDIEAEDKLVGPLTLRQFIYAGVTALCLYICFIGLAKHVYVIDAVFLPPGLLTGFFAFPFRRDQPTEIWALAKIRFLFKPRRRIWNQSGVKELVTITAPRRVEVDYTNGLSQNEVRSRLRALADTIDSRGWAIKNVDVNLYSQPATLAAVSTGTDSDRLIDPNSMPQDVPSYGVTATDDMFDEQNSPVAQQFNTMLDKSSQAHRQQVVQEMNNVQEAATLPAPVTPPSQPPPSAKLPLAPPNDYWFLNQPAGTAAAHGMNSQVVTPTDSFSDNQTRAGNEPTEDEEALARHLHEQNQTPQIAYPHLHTILPLSEQNKRRAQQQAEPQSPAAVNTPPNPPTPPVTPAPDPATLNYANNDDLTVATIARQVNKPSDDESPDEVVISLH